MPQSLLDSVAPGPFPPNTRQARIRNTWVNIPGSYADKKALVGLMAEAYPDLFRATDPEIREGLPAGIPLLARIDSAASDSVIAGMLVRW